MAYDYERVDIMWASFALPRATHLMHITLAAWLKMAGDGYAAGLMPFQ